ncbi:MAG: MFS transporter [Acidimicrobiia bacterium]|nr:MFS transporter [Acidimicrobiia bacterium]
MRSFSTAGLSAITAAAMGTGVFPIIVSSVLAAEFIAAFDISRAQVGLLVTSSGLVGGLLAPSLGRLTDRIGAVTATRGVLIVGAVTMTGIALAPTYPILVTAALAAGIANGWCNPATNLLIVDNMEPGRRGVVTGIKQSGVPITTFLAGLLLPAIAVLSNWRVAVLMVLLMPIGALVAMTRRESQPRHAADSADAAGGYVPVSVKWIAVYAAVSGLATNAAFVFIPLFAEEDQAWSPQAAGALLAMVGLVGVAARITWPQLSERRLGHGPTLRILGGLSMMSAAILAVAAVGEIPAWLLVVSAVLLGAGSIAWNAVGMLAVMDLTPKGTVGRGTGIVLLGFLFGSAAGTPLLGLSVDLLGTYGPGWISVAVLHAATILIAFKIPKGSVVAAS